MTDLPTLPEQIRDTTTVEEKGGHIIVTCRTTGHEARLLQALYIAQIIGNDREIQAGDLNLSNAEAISELLGNMQQHQEFGLPEKPTTQFVIDPKTHHCEATTKSYVRKDMQQRMSEKFQAAQALTNQQAIQRLEKIMEAGEFDGVETSMGQLTAGMGMLTMRAVADGPLKLTFFPDQSVTIDDLGSPLTMEKFEFSVPLSNHPGKLPEPQLKDIAHEGAIRGFFPHVVRKG